MSIGIRQMVTQSQSSLSRVSIYRVRTADLHGSKQLEELVAPSETLGMKAIGYIPFRVLYFPPVCSLLAFQMLASQTFAAFIEKGGQGALTFVAVLMWAEKL